MNQLFPFPQCWWKTFQSAIPAFLGGGWWALEVWRFGWWTIASSFLEPILAITPGILTIWLIGVSMLWYLLSIGLYQLALKLLWSRPPQWLKPRTFGGLMMGWLIINLAVTASASIVFKVPPMPRCVLKPSAECASQTMFEIIEKSPNHEVSIPTFTVMSMMIAAYLYQFTYRFQQRRKSH